MAFKKIVLMDIYEIIRRWHGKQPVSSIAQVTGYDRKTVRRYINTARILGLNENQDLPDKEAVMSLLKDSVKDRTFIQPAREILFPYRDEIIQLIENSEYRLRPKIAYEVIYARHDRYKKASYSSFKRFYRTHCQIEIAGKTTCRIETPAGRNAQIDYAKMGLLYDQIAKKNRSVYAFIATLSFSRHKYAEFVFKQDAKSFVRFTSIIDQVCLSVRVPQCLFFSFACLPAGRSLIFNLIFSGSTWESNPPFPILSGNTRF